MRRVLLLALSLAAMISGAPVSAQETQSRAQPPPSPITTGWQDGFFIQSADGSFRVQVGLLAHADAHFAVTDPDHAVTDTFLFRRLRPYLRGRFARRFEFSFVPDFAGGVLVVQDAYFDTVFAPAFRVRLGKGKTPFGLERLHPAANLTFFDRALPTAIVPNRDIGVQVLGDISGGLVSYLAGVMNGVVDGASSDSDTGDSKDVSGRFIVRPFTKIRQNPLAGLGLAISGSTGRQTAASGLPTFRTPSMLQTFYQYDSTAVADGIRRRYSPQVFYYYKGFGGWFEEVHSRMPIRKGLVREKISHDAWQVAGSYVLTGEAATDSTVGVRPRANFDFGQGHWGAFQIAARYQRLTVDDKAFALGFAAPGSSGKAAGWTAGLNWYLSQNFKYTLNFERIVFDEDPDGPRKAENGIAFRTQVNF
jgi:phosphate-selective porin OprO/OprP